MTNYTAEARKITEKCYPIPGAFAAGGAVTSVFTGKDINDVDVPWPTKTAGGVFQPRSGP
jgi:hypothetical protein